MTPARTTRLVVTAFVVFVVVAFARGTLFSQAPAGPAGGAQAAAQAAPAGPPVTLKGKLERVKVHGKSLEGNLLGESPEPEVSIEDGVGRFVAWLDSEAASASRK